MLRLANPPKSLKPLPLARRSPPSGAKVYAIGNPGLGTQLLEQTLSDGIVSAPSRQVQGQTFLQHTAATNRGNSGGPLLDTKGHVVGINTLVAELRDVNFAIPAERLREVLRSP